MIGPREGLFLELGIAEIAAPPAWAAPTTASSLAAVRAVFSAARNFFRL